MPWYLYLNKHSHLDKLSFALYFASEQTVEYLLLKRKLHLITSEESFLLDDSNSEFENESLIKNKINYFETIDTRKIITSINNKINQYRRILLLSNKSTIGWLESLKSEFENLQILIDHIMEFESPNNENLKYLEILSLINYLEINGIDVIHINSESDNRDIRKKTRDCGLLKYLKNKSESENSHKNDHINDFKLNSNDFGISSNIQTKVCSGDDKYTQAIYKVSFSETKNTNSFLNSSSEIKNKTDRTEGESKYSIPNGEINNYYKLRILRPNHIDYFESLFVDNTNPSLLEKIDLTVSLEGRKLFKEKLKNPLDEVWIIEMENFMNNFSNSSLIRRMRNLIKEIVDIQSEIEKNNEVNLDATFYIDRSDYEMKSIYSRTTLEEKSINKYRSVIRLMKNMKNNQRWFHKIRDLFDEIADKEYISSFQNLTKILNNSKMNEIDQILEIISNEENTPIGMLYDPLCWVVSEGIDEYLDVCRTIYQKKIEKGQREALRLIENKELEIHLADKREICIKSKAISKHKKRLRKDQNKYNIKVRSTDISENKYGKENTLKFNHEKSTTSIINDTYRVKNLQTSDLNNTSITKNISISENEEILGQIIQKDNEYFVIKETKLSKIYSNSQLTYLNRIIEDSLMQIIEIEGKLCNELILRLRNFFDFIVEIFQELGKLDLMISCLLESTTPGMSTPIESNKIKIKAASNYLIPNSIKIDYCLEKNDFYLITGVNMSGKSSYIRNLAHIILQSRIGMHIKCDYIEIPKFDEVYFISTIEHLNSFCNRMTLREVSDELRNQLQENTEFVFNNKNVNIPNSLDYENRSESSFQDEASLHQIDRQDKIGWTRYGIEDYRTPNRIVLVDEIQCSIELQKRLIEFLLKSNIMTLYVTHTPDIMEFLTNKNKKIYKLENFTLTEGSNKDSSVKHICRRFFPEIQTEL